MIRKRDFTMTTTELNRNNSIKYEQFGRTLIQMLPKFINKIEILKDEMIINVKSDYIKETLEFLKDYTNSQFKCLMEITAVDYPEKEKRFEVVYMLLSVKYNNRLIIKTYVDEMTPLDSVVSIYNSAGWYEREVWDMFGIYFSNHPDLRRILTDYGFEGHPMRKDFPLSGYVEVRYDDEKKRVVTEPIEMTQEFRSFDFLSPWEQLK